MDLDEVMMRADDKSSENGNLESQKNDTRNSSKQSRNRKGSLKVICVDKSQSSDKKLFTETKATGSVNLSLTKASEKQIARQN